MARFHVVGHVNRGRMASMLWAFPIGGMLGLGPGGVGVDEALDTRVQEGLPLEYAGGIPLQGLDSRREWLPSGGKGDLGLYCLGLCVWGGPVYSERTWRTPWSHMS